MKYTYKRANKTVYKRWKENGKEKEKKKKRVNK